MRRSIFLFIPVGLAAACSAFGTTTTNDTPPVTPNDDAGATVVVDGAILPRIDSGDPLPPIAFDGGSCREKFADTFDSGSVAAWTNTASKGSSITVNPNSGRLQFFGTATQTADHRYLYWVGDFNESVARLTYSFRQDSLKDYVEVGCWLDFIGEGANDYLTVGPAMAAQFELLTTLALGGTSVDVARNNVPVPLPTTGTDVPITIDVRFDRIAKRYAINGTVGANTPVSVMETVQNFVPKAVQVRCGVIHTAKASDGRSGSVDNVVLTACGP